MNNSNLLLIKAIIMVYLSRLTNEDNPDIKSLCGVVLNNISVGTVTMGNGSDGDITMGLQDTLEWLLTLQDGNLTPLDLTTRIRINCHQDTHLIEIIKEALVFDDTTVEGKADISARVNNTMSEIKSELSSNKLTKVMKDATRKLARGGEFTDKSEFIANVFKELEEVKTAIRGKVEVLEAGLDFDKLDRVENYLEDAIRNVSTEGVLKTGLVGFNRAMHFGGFPRGYFINFAALTHNYKTGILLDMFRMIAMHNKPMMWDDTKKPLLLRMSFENRIEQDILKMYKDLREPEIGRSISIAEIDIKEAAQYLQGKLSVNGYTCKMLFFEAHDFSADAVIDVLQAFIDDGYEIHLLDLDYLELFAKNDKTVREDTAITNAILRLRGYCFPRGITVLSAHQLSTEAQELSRQGTSNFVDRVRTGGWYMNAKSLAQKLDTEFVMHILEQGEKSYLTVGRGKNRGGEDTPARHKVFAYEMHRLGTLHDDINLPSPTVIYDLYKLNGPTVAPSEETNMPGGF